MLHSLLIYKIINIYKPLVVQTYPYVLRSRRSHYSHTQEEGSGAVLGLFHPRRFRMLEFCGSRPRGSQDTGTSAAVLRSSLTSPSHDRGAAKQYITYLTDFVE